MKFSKALLLFLLTALTGTIWCSPAHAQSKELTQALKTYFLNYHADGFQPKMIFSKLKACDVDEHERHIHIYGNEGFSSQAFLPQTVSKIYEDIGRILPKSYKNYKVSVYAFNEEISTLIPNIYNNDKFPERLWNDIDYHGNPWVSNASRPVKFENGLQDRHISIWASHGRYYMNNKSRWAWQRPFLFCTTEDMFTLSIVTPFLIPMLENSGAVVFTPRERDWQTNEVIVDNDSISQGEYTEQNGREKWEKSDNNGYARKKETYYTNENPFFDGTARRIKSVSQEKGVSTAKWCPTIPENGKYAVYVSYQNLPDNVNDAHYSVIHKGTTTNFIVNQRMGGGTWVYLGTFEFDKEKPQDNCVVLYNYSRNKGTVSADAVRFGGGMGNIARGAFGSETTSGLPRFLEGARYSVQMAGFPDSTYDVYEGVNDYSDDLNSRSRALNYLASGSPFVPANIGGSVPFELSVAVHSDAGANADNSPYGTLTVHTQHNDFDETHYRSGLTRMSSADFAQIIQNTVCSDLTQTLGTTWAHREVLNRNYNETRVPEVPSSIVETLSHQNFRDMLLGHDPNFKFLMARAIYKSVAKFISHQHGKPCVIQPLPVTTLACSLTEGGNALLRWAEPTDALEPTAKPDGYIVYVRKDGQDYDNGTVINAQQCEIKLEPDVIYSFKVSAYNSGGESMPSEELSAMKASNDDIQIMIINGFNRMSAPAIVDNSDSLGFDLDKDFGVAYMKTPEYCGNQINYDRQKWGKEGENGLGYCGTEYQGQIIAGNTFNYPYIHGKAIQYGRNYSFVSCNVSAVNNGFVNLNDYKMIDLILGLQKDDGASSIYAYKTFTPELQQQIESYSKQGGKIFVSGSYIASDMNTSAERDFTTRVLHFSKSTEAAGSDSTIKANDFTFNIERSINAEHYAVTHPDVLTPANGSFCAFTYADGKSAGIAYIDEASKVIAFGFPFESITDGQKRNEIMQAITNMMFIP